MSGFQGQFTIVAESDFLMRSSAPTRTYTFWTLATDASNAVLDLSLLGGYRSGDENMTVQIDLNGAPLTTLIVNRWQSHWTLVLDRIATVIGGSKLHGGVRPFPLPPDITPNTLVLKPVWEEPTDYLFIGPIICNFHQVTP